MKRAAVILFLAWGASTAAQEEADSITPGRFLVDPPTLENLGFRWYVRGDANRNASVRVSYRPKGAGEWRRAMPLLRVRHEEVNRDFSPYRCGNLFAGSVFGLQPDREVEVRLVMEDPDGGAAPPKTVTVRTRGVPKRTEGGRTIHVYPAGSEKPEEAFDDVQAAARTAQPGDTLLFHPGVYKIERDGFYPFCAGTPGKPIVFLGSGEGEAVFEGADYRTTLIDVRNAAYLWFENLSFRHARTGIRGGSSGLNRSGKDGRAGRGLVVRRCTFTDVISGITTYSEYSENWYIADNVITGKNSTWYPRPRDAYMSPSHTGVNLYGRGHVVCHNRIRRFGDCVAIANFGKPVEDVELHCVAIDFHNNDLSEAKDDHIETDYGSHNIRVYRNRCFNGHTALSAQPLYGGPVYFFRNELYGITALCYKLHNWPSGIIIAHNTSVCARTAFQTAPLFQNTRMWNNLLLGRGGYTVEAGSPDPGTRLDYNGWSRSDDPVRFIRWQVDRKVNRFKTLESFREATGNGAHSMIVDLGIFEKARGPEEGVTYKPAEVDLRLREEAPPVDAGLRLPNFNDGFTGEAPDLGCYERGRPAPHYGPR